MAKTWFKQSTTFTDSFLVQSLAANNQFFEIFLYQKLLEIFLKQETTVIHLNAKQLARSVGVRVDNLIRSLDRIQALCELNDGSTIPLRYLNDGSTLAVTADKVLKLQESKVQTKTRLDIDKEKNIYIAQSSSDAPPDPDVFTQAKPEREIKKPASKPKPESQFDMEAAYQAYPRKLGKSPGLKRLAREITTESDYRGFLRAVEKYKKHCEENRTEAKFIKHFSTFISEWRDWNDPDTGSSEVFSENVSALEQWKKQQDLKEKQNRNEGLSNVS